MAEPFDECDCCEFNYEEVVRDSGEITITNERETGWISYHRNDDPENEQSFQADCCGWAELCHDLGLSLLVERKSA